MAVQPFDHRLRRDAGQLALPLANQVRRRDDQRDLTGAHVRLEGGRDVRGDGDGRRPADRGLAHPHLADQQDAVAILQPARDGGDHVLLRAVQGVPAVQADGAQPAPDPVQVEAVHRLEARAQVVRQRASVGADEAQQRGIALHLDGRAIGRQQRERGGRLQAEGGLLHLALRIVGIGLDLDARDVFDMARPAAQRHAPVLRRLDHRAIGHAGRQHQRQMPRTRRDHRLDLDGGRRRLQQRLKAAGLPRALLADEGQPGLGIEHVRGEDEALQRAGRGQAVARLGLHGEGLRMVAVAHDLLVERGGVGRHALDGCDHPLIVLAEMLARQRPDVDAAAVPGQERRRFAGEVVLVDAPQRQSAVLHPLPGVAQVAELDALAARCAGVVVVGGIEPRRTERIVRRDQPLHIAAHGLRGAEAGDAGRRAFAVQLIGVGREVPGARRRFEERAFPGERVEDAHGGGRGGDERQDRRVVFRLDGQVAHDHLRFGACHVRPPETQKPPRMSGG